MSSDFSELLSYDHDDSPVTAIPTVSRPSQFWHLAAGNWNKEFDSVAIVCRDYKPVDCLVRHFDAQGKLLGSKTLFTGLDTDKKWMGTLAGPGIEGFQNQPGSYLEIEASGLVLLIGLRSDKNGESLWYNAPTYIYSEPPVIEVLETRTDELAQGRLIIGFRGVGMQAFRIEARTKNNSFLVDRFPLLREDGGLDFYYEGVTGDVEYEMQLVGPGGLTKSGKRFFRMPTKDLPKQKSGESDSKRISIRENCDFFPFHLSVEQNGIKLR